MILRGEGNGHSNASKMGSDIEISFSYLNCVDNLTESWGGKKDQIKLTNKLKQLENYRFKSKLLVPAPP